MTNNLLNVSFPADGEIFNPKSRTYNQLGSVWLSIDPGRRVDIFPRNQKGQELTIVTLLGADTAARLAVEILARSVMGVEPDVLVRWFQNISAALDDAADYVDPTDGEERAYESEKSAADTMAAVIMAILVAGKE